MGRAGWLPPRLGTSNIYEGYREEGKRFDVNTSSLPARADGQCGGQPCAGQSRRAILWLHHLRVSHQKKKKKKIHENQVRPSKGKEKGIFGAMVAITIEFIFL